jgi:hypothetical protein
MMMRMLEAGGIEVLSDGVRRADADNPRGYYEFERVKQIERDKSWLDDAEGRVVKMISQLLRHLPSDYTYRVIFMRRRMAEILASQRRMLVRRGESTDAVSDERMAALFRDHIRRVGAWLDQQPNFAVITVSYNEVLEDPVGQAKRINRFCGDRLDVEAMVNVVDRALYRQRG